MVLGEFFDILLIDHDEAGQVRPLVADHDGVGNIGREFKLVLDLRGVMFLPPEVMMMSFIRSVILTKPSLSIVPTSPVCSQPGRRWSRRSFQAG